MVCYCHFKVRITAMLLAYKFMLNLSFFKIRVEAYVQLTQTHQEIPEGKIFKTAEARAFCYPTSCISYHHVYNKRRF